MNPSKLESPTVNNQKAVDTQPTVNLPVSNPNTNIPTTSVISKPSSKITVHLNNHHSQLIIILIYIFIYILFITPIDRKFMSKFVPKIKLIFRSKTIVCL